MAKKFSFEAAAEKEAERLMKKLAKTEPGTKEYRELQNQLGAYEIMKEKRKSGVVSKSEWIKFIVNFVGTGVLTAATLTADYWIPRVSDKLRLGELVKRIIK